MDEQHDSDLEGEDYPSYETTETDDEAIESVSDSSDTESKTLLPPTKKRRAFLEIGTPKKKPRLERQNATVKAIQFETESTEEDDVNIEEDEDLNTIATTKCPLRMKNFVWTLNNYTDADLRRMEDYGEVAKYHVFGFETSKKGTPHLQGFTMLDKQVSFNVLKKLPQPFGKCAMYNMKGTPKQASDYCKKTQTFFEYGELPTPLSPARRSGKPSEQGKRTDIIEVVEKVKAGATDRMLLEENPNTTFKYLRHIQQIRSLCKPTRTNALEVIICYGTPGCGKTHWAYATYPGLFQLPVGKDFWMDQYQRQPQVLFDDFNGNVSLTNCLQIMDKYIIQVPIKGGFVWWCPEKIVITTNVHPCNWYDYSKRQDSYLALERRITQVLKFTYPNVTSQGKEYLAPKETSVHNFFHYQKVIGKFCEDISNNMSDNEVKLLGE